MTAEAARRGELDAVIGHDGTRQVRRRVTAGVTSACHPGLALGDPAALARAAAIVRTALSRGRLAHPDLDDRQVVKAARLLIKAEMAERAGQSVKARAARRQGQATA